MGPLSFFETENFNLEKVFISGLLPPHFLSPSPLEDLRSYVSDYLREEIAAESSVRNIPAFSEFLRVAGQTNSELLNYTNIARESGVSAKVVRNYFEILEDTLLGKRLSSWKAFKKRRVITTDKFYFFDVGVANYLAKRNPLPETPDFGRSFEHYIFMELCNYQRYRDPELDIRYWKSASGLEVDFVCNDMHTAIEVKSSRRIHAGHLKGLKSLREEYAVKNLLLVCLEEEPRIVEGDIQILPWKVFLQKMWVEGELF